MARFRSPFQLVFPGIQQLPLQLQLTRQRLNVFTDLHSFHNLPLELHAVSTPLCHSGPSCHIASIRCKSASFPRVSLSGFSPEGPRRPPWRLLSGHQLLMTRYGPLDILGMIGQEREYEGLLAHTV